MFYEITFDYECLNRNLSQITALYKYLNGLWHGQHGRPHGRICEEVMMIVTLLKGERRRRYRCRRGRGSATRWTAAVAAAGDGLLIQRKQH